MRSPADLRGQQFQGLGTIDLTDPIGCLTTIWPRSDVHFVQKIGSKDMATVGTGAGRSEWQSSLRSMRVLAASWSLEVAQEGGRQ